MRIVLLLLLFGLIAPYVNSQDKNEREDRPSERDLARYHSQALVYGLWLPAVPMYEATLGKVRITPKHISFQDCTTDYATIGNDTKEDEFWYAGPSRPVPIRRYRDFRLQVRVPAHKSATCQALKNNGVIRFIVFEQAPCGAIVRLYESLAALQSERHLADGTYIHECALETSK
jgi:hypothetical protein